jgi:histidinol-phosphatase
MQKREYLEVAVAAAQAAGKIIEKLYKSNLQVEYKADRTPVTVADVEAEKAVLQIIRQKFPDHGFWGEETGKSKSDAEFQWLIDPIDGTKNFVRQNGIFSTQIALLHNHEFILGVSHASDYEELAYAERGHGAWLNGKPIRVSETKILSEATLSLGNIQTLARSSQWPNLGKLVSQVNRVRGYGDFLHYHFLASGKVDLVIESDVNILDVAALAVIVREAGGVFTDLNGDAPSLTTTSVLAANSPQLHAAALNMLKG